MNKNSKKRRRLSANDMQLYCLCLIPMLLVFAFNYVPMLGTIMAFKDYRYDQGILGSRWIGLKNFKTFLMGGEFPKLVRNTVGMNFIFIVVGLVCSVALAILMYRVTSRLFTKVYQTIFILPYFVSWVLVAYIVYAFLSPSAGVLNKIMIMCNLEEQNWYSKTSIWPGILTICNTWKNVGMDSIYYYAALMSIDATLFEAAEVDGAKNFDKVKNIIIPSLVPLMTILTIMKIGGIFVADFGLFYQVPRNVGALYDVTDVISTYNFRVMRDIGNMGLGTAISLFQSVVGIILVLITNSLSKKIDKDLGLF